MESNEDWVLVHVDSAKEGGIGLGHVELEIESGGDRVVALCGSNKYLGLEHVDLVRDD